MRCSAILGRQGHSTEVPNPGLGGQMLINGAKELEQARRLERGLIRVRWFAVALGFYLVTQTNIGFAPHASHTVLALAYTIMGTLALGNVAITFATRRTQTLEGFRRLGLAAFAFDAMAI